MPGTRFAGQNANCSVSAKKFFGLVSKVKTPTSKSGNLSSGQNYI